MSRAYHTSRARRATQPIAIIRQRDPSIRTLGFGRFRLSRVPGSSDFAVEAFAERTNAMAAFARLGRQ